MRLQELELSQREQELKNTSKQFSPLSSLSLNQINDESNSTVKHNTNTSVKKDDLNARIEKIYTEQQNEEDDLSTDGLGKDSGKMSSSFDDSNSPRSSSQKNFKQTKSQQKLNSIVVTKTSPLVAAALGFDDDEEDFSLMLSDNSAREKLLSKTSLIDNSIKHQIIKQVSDSMDNLKNELLNKGMDKYADDVEIMSKNLETTKKKTEEMERIRREQDLIKKEKVGFF